jgi:hypothetical protein
MKAMPAVSLHLEQQQAKLLCSYRMEAKRRPALAPAQVQNKQLCQARSNLE